MMIRAKMSKIHGPGTGIHARLDTWNMEMAQREARAILAETEPQDTRLRTLATYAHPNPGPLGDFRPWPIPMPVATMDSQIREALAESLKAFISGEE